MRTVNVNADVALGFRSFDRIHFQVFVRVQGQKSNYKTCNVSSIHMRGESLGVRLVEINDKLYADSKGGAGAVPQRVKEMLAGVMSGNKAKLAEAITLGVYSNC